jgi:PleD family two-component response regulator
MAQWQPVITDPAQRKRTAASRDVASGSRVHAASVKQDPDAPAPSPEQPIRLLIVDDHELVRDGLAEMIGRLDDFVVVGTASGGHAALDLYRAERPDVVIVDLRMTPMDGIQTITA